MKTGTKVALIVFTVLLLDQILKIWVKTNMLYDQEIFIIGDWFRFKFVENPGMAFGLKFDEIPILKSILSGPKGERAAKILLTVFRIIAVFFIARLLNTMIKNAKTTKFTIYSMALILAGAIGNIIDSLFYGKVFSKSDRGIKELATIFPEGGGYENFFHGKVVDMLYFPIVQNGSWPDWVPFIGGNRFDFFNAIFNLADASISIGVMLLIISIFFFHKEHDTNELLVESVQE